jgi:hypothetical protein
MEVDPLNFEFQEEAMIADVVEYFANNHILIEYPMNEIRKDFFNKFLINRIL